MYTLNHVFLLFLRCCCDKYETGVNTQRYPLPCCSLLQPELYTAGQRVLLTIIGPGLCFSFIQIKAGQSLRPNDDKLVTHVSWAPSKMKSREIERDREIERERERERV